MQKVESLGEVSKWGNLNRDILGLIFNKLDVMDIAMGASRVCISWFLASHKRTLWNTVDISKVRRVIELEVDVKDLMEYQNNLRSFFLYKFLINNEQETGVTLMKLLIVITKLSHMVPKNLFFKFNSVVEEDELMFAAEKMPNIEKLVLPIQCYQTKESSWFAFSQWKNLTTLIFVHQHLHTGKFHFQAVGENCSNLTNFKYMCNLQEGYAEEIVCFLQSLKRLSLRGSLVSIDGVLTLITGLNNLTILNLSHCKYPNSSPMALSRDMFVQAASQKLEKIIICCQDCRFCKGQSCFLWSPFSKTWKNDEIKELEF